MLLGEERKRKKLKPEAIPTVFSWKRSTQQKPRKTRTSSTATTSTSELPSTSATIIVSEPIEEFEVVIENEPESVYTNTITETPNPTADQGIQCSLLTNAFYKLEYFTDNQIKYLTGFQSSAHLQFFFNCLEPGINHLRYQSRNIDQPNQLFMTLIRLRHHTDYTQLAINFNLTRQVVSEIITQMINFLYYELTEFDVWLSRGVVDTYFPLSFKQEYPLTRVILDATEIPIDRPTECNSQSATFSTYKNKNTLKVLVGISPRGQVTFVSDVYGGSTSDRQILERSALVKRGMFERQDQIMADRGIMVQDLVCSLDVTVNTPTTMRGVNQLPAETVVKDRKIASKRIHVERVIGYAKTFKILEHLSTTSMPLSKKIIHVCLLLVNFRDCIVAKNS